jgi:hypothetical protein
MFVFISGLPQRVAMIPDPDDQGTQPQWTMIRVGRWFLVNSKMLFLIISRRICPGEVVSIPSETDYRSAPANPEDTGVLERGARVSNYEFQ